MSFVLTSLPPLPLDSPSKVSGKLPELHPLFFVPSLEDKPQNPIVDALIEASLSANFGDGYGYANEYQEEVQLNDDNEGTEQELWSVNPERRQRKNQNLSWDALRSTFPTEATSTPFLSEQSNDVFDAVRHHVRPRLHDPSLQLRYILPTELLELLLMNMVGNSSPMYIWDPEHERFVPSGVREGARLIVIIEGLDEVASDSIIKRFLNIGTLMRRLDVLVLSMQQKNGNPIVHSFLHSVSMVLVHVRSILTRKPPHPTTWLTSLWLHYSETEELLSALAALCGRCDEDAPPYEKLPESPAALLSHIYSHLHRHIEHRSLRPITAMMAYILTIASRDYFAEIGESLGLYEPSRPPWLRTATPSKRNWNRGNDLTHLEDEAPDQSAVSTSDDHEDESPNFFPPDLVEALPAARKSLRILQAADPDHPLCHTIVTTACGWVWSPTEVERLWQTQQSTDEPGDIPRESHPQSTVTTDTPPRDYKPELAQFQIFDLEPGTHITDRTCSADFGSWSSLEDFISNFPERLSPLTPTLGHLATVVLQPLVARTITLSRSLLRLYLTSLHFESHLALLRSYLLLTLSSFKTRLVEALFSDSDEYRPLGRGTRARTRARLGIVDARDIADAAEDPGSMQGIGLGHGLAERDTWPPGGTDLSFFLRTVVVDSLEQRITEVGTGGNEAENVWKEAEFRMGFALRNLPVGDGRERWLNPMSIEALDFLSLVYNPPHPLEIVITPDVLSKYQRIFTFLLRLLRADTVARIAFRASFKSDSPVFEYSPEAQKRLFRLRFQIQTFVTSLVAYVFDSAIGGNFDAYLRRISKLREGVSDDTLPEGAHDIMDVFTLGESHSELVNRILSGCLLRTGQRSAGVALRDLLELVLQFGRLIVDVRRGRVKEAHAAEELGELDESFQKRMLSFIASTQVLHAKDQVVYDQTNTSRWSGYLRGVAGDCMETGSPLQDLITRIDPTGWWRQGLERQHMI